MDALANCVPFVADTLTNDDTELLSLSAIAFTRALGGPDAALVVHTTRALWLLAATMPAHTAAAHAVLRDCGAVVSLAALNGAGGEAEEHAYGALADGGPPLKF